MSQFGTPWKLRSDRNMVEDASGAIFMEFHPTGPAVKKPGRRIAQATWSPSDLARLRMVMAAPLLFEALDKLLTPCGDTPEAREDARRLLGRINRGVPT